MKQQMAKYPAHLGRGGRAAVLPEFTGGMAWYDAYGAAYPDDDVDGRLVSLFTFTAPWDSWEMHPKGDEIVLCSAGSITLIREHADGGKDSVTLNAGDYAINPPGCWHTADIDGEATVLFITAGEGTQHRPR